MLKVIAVRYIESRIVFIEEYESVTQALGAASTGNRELLMVGMRPEWAVFVVDGSDWYRVDNYVNSGVRYDFMQFLNQMGGEFAGFKLENFKAMDREDF